MSTACRSLDKDASEDSLEPDACLVGGRPQAGASTRAEQGLGTTRKTKIMRRLKQLDRSEALPVNRIHGSGQVFSARYR